MTNTNKHCWILVQSFPSSYPKPKCKKCNKRMFTLHFQLSKYDPSLGYHSGSPIDKVKEGIDKYLPCAVSDEEYERNETIKDIIE